MSRLNPFSSLIVKSKILIAFITAHHPSRSPHVANQRARMIGSLIEYKFVYGDRLSQSEPMSERSPEKDELFFNVNDTRPYMVMKDKALFQWALSRGYDFVFRACDDTIVYPERILQNLEMLRAHDYAGTMCGYGNLVGYNQPYVLRYLDYMHGGVGIWLSARAMQMLVADDWKGPCSSPLSNNIEILPGTWFKGPWHIYWDDLWIGEVLKGNLNYSDPRRNDVYSNYLVHVWDNPELFASNTPFDSDKVISTHSTAQMGSSSLKPKPFSTRTGSQVLLNVQWDTAKADFKAVEPGKTI